MFGTWMRARREERERKQAFFRYSTKALRFVLPPYFSLPSWDWDCHLFQGLKDDAIILFDGVWFTQIDFCLVLCMPRLSNHWATK